MCGGRPLMIASVTKILLKSWGEDQWFAGGVGEPAGGECVDEQFADRTGCEGSVLVADGALEQQRHRRVPDPFPDVVGRHQGYRTVRCAEAGDDGAEHVGEFRADEHSLN